MRAWYTIPGEYVDITVMVISAEEKERLSVGSARIPPYKALGRAGFLGSCTILFLAGLFVLVAFVIGLWVLSCSTI